MEHLQMVENWQLFSLGEEKPQITQIPQKNIHR